MCMPKKRCSWVKDDPLAIQYHDEEFGVPLEGDDELFERLSLEIFQAGLNWRLILRKREGLRKAFADFSIAKVAKFTERDVLRLLRDNRIIKNKLKIAATIENAKRVREIAAEFGSFAAFIATLHGSEADMQREMKKRFVFMGPKISESFLQSIGKLEGQHEPDCWMYGRR